MANLFVSYNRESEKITETLVDDIQALGHNAWFDEELSGGQTWWDQILSTIRDCDVFVLVLSPKSLSSTACTREYGYAADLGKPILPILVSEGVSVNLLPPVLSQIQFVDYREQDREAAFRLARALNSLPSPEPLPDPLPAPPEVPISYLGSLTERLETTANLSYEEQSALIVDLKRSLRESETTDDARALLERLRKRRDLLATIAEEIDELLAGTPKTSSAPPQASAPKQPPQDPPAGTQVGQQPPVTEPPNQYIPQSPTAIPVAAPAGQPKPKRRWILAIVIVLASVFVGWGLAILTYEIFNLRSDPVAFFVWGATIVAGLVVAIKFWKGK
jgi:hypothetical protein